MCRTILPLLVFGSFIVTFADSAIQTDWSGDSGYPGPVTEWADNFYTDVDVEWDSNPGYITLLSITEEHTIDDEFVEAWSVYSEDIDGDGDMDVLGAAKVDDEITWWENIDGSGTSWAEYTIDGNFNGAISVYSADINGDGDMDVLGAASIADDITWWENSDTGSGIYWVEHTIDADYSYPRKVYSEDIDGDGDMDVLGCGSDPGNHITWWENINGSGLSWTEYTVYQGGYEGACAVYSEDIDGDGDMDVLGASSMEDAIVWWDSAGYVSDGLLESSILDTQSNPDWDYIEWNLQTPLGTSVSFQVRASDDHTSMGEWSDTLSVPCSLDGILNDGDRYVQYRTILETPNPGLTPLLNDVTISWDFLGIEETAEPFPLETELFPIAPNPSASSPIIRFGLLEPASVKISVFDLSGRMICEIQGNEYSTGFHDVLIGDLSPGIYFCRMISGDFTATQRFVVIE